MIGIVEAENKTGGRVLGLFPTSTKMLQALYQGASYSAVRRLGMVD